VESTNWWAVAFILSVVVGVGLFVVYPLGEGFLTSLEHYRISQSTFVGIKNYEFVLTSPLFWAAIRNTFIYTIGAVPLSLLIALLIAEAIHPLSKRWQNIIKAVLYLPGATSGVVIALVWLWIFNPISGFANFAFRFFHLPPQGWIYSSHEAMLSVLLTVWLGGNGGNVVLYSAARNQIPTSIYEAASLDHTSKAKVFWRITIPLMNPTIVYTLVLGLIGSFQVFAPIYLLTKGGPNLATTTLAYQIYQFAFRDQVFGVAAAEAFILGVMIMIFTIVSYRVMSSDIQY
jgi:multiple sugar transport system permease protein